jgi:MFS family permease
MSASTAGEKNPNPPVTWLSLPNKPQLFILAICRLSEPLSNTCLLPYLYYLIRSLQTTPHTTPASISRQAGLLVSLFALSQFATSVPWAYIANTWGRRPSIIIGITLSIVSNIGFGFSTSIPAVMFWRVLAGIGNGNIGVMRTMTAEIVKEKKYQSRAFLLLPLIFNSGVVIGLALGGCLADPIINLPWLFGPTGVLNLAKDPAGVAWMRKYPFALPTIFNAGVLVCSLLLAVFGLKETMPGKEEHRDLGLMVGGHVKRFLRRTVFKRKEAGYTVLEDDSEETKILTTVRVAEQPSRLPPRLSITSRAIYTREVLVTIISFGLLPLHNSAFMQLFPVFLSTPPSSHPNPNSNAVATSPNNPSTSSPSSPTNPSTINTRTSFLFNGGLGLPSPTIGLFLSFFGIFGILIQLLLYPSLQARLGTLRSYRLALSIFPFAYMLSPYLALIPLPAISLQYLSIAAILFLQVTARTFGIPSSVILLTNSAPNPGALGAVHGVGNMLSSLSRAVGPALGGVIFGLGMDRNCVGAVWWGYLTTISITGLAWSWMLTEGEHPTLRRKCVEAAEPEVPLQEFTDNPSEAGETENAFVVGEEDEDAHADEQGEGSGSERGMRHTNPEGCGEKEPLSALSNSSNDVKHGW